jgi:hypothetical protein
MVRYREVQKIKINVEWLQDWRKGEEQNKILNSEADVRVKQLDEIQYICNARILSGMYGNFS